MSSNITRNIIRAVLLLLLQLLILKRIDISIGNFNYLHLLVYPLIIMLLPLKTPKIIVIVVSFILGLSIDMFYDSPGVHAGALVFIGYIRSFILKFLEPNEGYTAESTPTLFRMGVAWFLVYSSVLLITHHLIYFSLEAFSYVYLLEILLRTIFSFIGSLIILMIVMFITNPKY